MEQKIIDGKDLAGMKFIKQEDGSLKVYEPKRKKFVPKNGEYYYYVNVNGVIHDITKHDNIYNDYLVAHNHVFRTKEDAEDYRLFLDQLDKYSYKFSKEEWNDRNLHKHFLVLFQNTLTIDYNLRAMKTCTYFKTQEDIKSFIEEAGEERIKNYMFDIWEE